MQIQRSPLLPITSANSYQPPYLLPRYSATSVMSSSLSGNRCGVVFGPQTTSGPAPTFAATAALGWMSSRNSLSSLTGTPVASVNAATFLSNWMSSVSTKRFQRNARKVAPSSGWNGISWAHALAQSSSDVPPSNAPAPSALD